MVTLFLNLLLSAPVKILKENCNYRYVMYMHDGFICLGYSWDHSVYVFEESTPISARKNGIKKSALVV